MEAEIACEVLSAEDGRDLHRRAWSQLMDRVDPDLQSWLAAHPGRYLLKMTLPHGLKGSAGERRPPWPNCTGASPDAVRPAPRRP